jgi:hypothetical protein
MGVQREGEPTVETHSSVELGANDNTGEHYLGTWTRIYLHGVIAFVVFYVLAYVVTRLVPIFEFTGNRALAIALSILAIL